MTRTSSLLLLALAACSSASAAPAPLPPPPAVIPGAWSPTVGGLHARLLATPAADTSMRVELRLELELENVADSATPIPVGWGTMNDMLRLTLEDAAGKPVTLEAAGGSFASGPPFVVLLPVHSSLRSLISAAAYEYVGPKQLLRPLTFEAWDVTAVHGPLFLRGTFTPSAAGAKPLELPRVALP